MESKNISNLVYRFLTYSGLSFISGFAVYFFVKKIKVKNEIHQYNESLESTTNTTNEFIPQTEIPIEILEKIIRKVKNKIIIILANLFDRTVLLKKIEDQKPLITEEIKNENDEYINKEEVIAQKEAVRKQIIRNYFSSKNIHDQIIKQETSIVNKYKYKTDQYVTSLIALIPNSKNLRNDINLINNFKISVENCGLMPFDFGECIKNNYIKIISNIYYLNIRKVQNQFRYEYIDKGYIFKDLNDTSKVLNRLYSSNLKQTRIDVQKFFKIPENTTFDLKIILRLYYYYLDSNDENRIKMDEINGDVNQILEDIGNGYQFDLFFEKNDVSVCDRILDFKEAISTKRKIDDLIFEDEIENKNEIIIQNDDEIQIQSKSDNPTK